MSTVGASPLAGRRVLICGLGIAGASAVRAATGAGGAAHVALTARDAGPRLAELTALGAHWLGPATRVPDGIDLVIASPGLRPGDPLLRDAASRQIDVWGEVELAWRLRGPQAPPWLALTGTNGKTTTVRMLEAMLTAAGLRARAVGNVGVPVIDAVLAGPAYDVLAVELSSQQLHFAPSLAPAAGALLNLAPDHLDWHVTMADYQATKARVWNGVVAVANLDDPLVAATAPPACVWFTLAPPAPGQLGVQDGRLVSRAFGDDEAVLAAVDRIRPAGWHNVANALAAAALARSHGVPPAAIGAGLAAFVPDPHRNALLTVSSGVSWVDDSKATNPHAAYASLSAYDPVVWIAGGQLKGVDIDDLVRSVAGRLRGCVVLGVDRAQVVAALARHAPDVPVIVVENTDDMAMTEVVAAAATMARAGDTVLLAPAAASYDMFSGYPARGAAFAAAVQRLPERPTPSEGPGQR